MLVDAKQQDGASLGTTRRARADGAPEAVTAEQLWTRYAARLTSIVVRYLRADYWHMPQVGLLSFDGPRSVSRRLAQC